MRVAFLLLVSALLACASRKPTLDDLVGGRWTTGRWEPAHTLIFHDRSVYVDNNFDSVFSLGYRLSHDTLITVGPNGEFRNHISVISDSLIEMEGFHDVRERRLYHRKP